ncbi:hypothetical protein R1N34_23850, partial [Klebsiella sp. 75660]
KSAQIREILISESAWEEMTCLFAPSIAKKASFLWIFFIYNQSVYFLSERKEGFHSQIQMPR